jgi:O-acetyl-ADP-ribose deacetylase
MKAFVGNLLESIESEKIDAIQNAANCIGPMGAGIAGAIRRYGGTEIQSEAFDVCKTIHPIAGDAYCTISGKLKELGVKKIIHAATMKNPGGVTSYKIIESAFKSAIELAKKLDLKRMGCTALGTGVGGLDSVEVAKIMKKIAKAEKDIEIIFIDFDKKFIDEINSEDE